MYNMVGNEGEEFLYCTKKTMGRIWIYGLLMEAQKARTVAIGGPVSVAPHG